MKACGGSKEERREIIFWKSGSCSRSGESELRTNFRFGFLSSSVGLNFFLAFSILVRASAVRYGMMSSIKRYRDLVASQDASSSASASGRVIIGFSA